jgi:hypothetical protein
MCEYCNAKIYVAKRKIMKDLMQPLTPEGVLRQQLEDITGIQYLEIKNIYCPMCR